jgi:hypothetical protein
MKNIAFITLVIIIGLFTSCDKGGELAPLPSNDPSGDYFYKGESNYYNSDGSLDFNGTTAGSLSTILNLNSKSISISILPNIGYSYIIQGSNLEVHGDTTTFRIVRQQITIGSSYNQTFNLEGTNGIKVGNLGYYDGFFTSKEIQLHYRSINIESLDYVKSHLVAKKRN